jgi:hypothetical protein
VVQTPMIWTRGGATIMAMQQTDRGSFAGWLARHRAFRGGSLPVAVMCEECGRELEAIPGRVELVRDGGPIFYCEQCWQREFGIGACASGGAGQGPWWR